EDWLGWGDGEAEPHRTAGGRAAGKADSRFIHAFSRDENSGRQSRREGRLKIHSRLQPGRKQRAAEPPGRPTQDSFTPSAGTKTAGGRAAGKVPQDSFTPSGTEE